MCKEELQGELEWRIIPAFSIAENSAWAEANFSGSRQQGLPNTGGLGWLGCGGGRHDMSVQLLACWNKLHWRIHVINPGWLEEWTTDWLG